MTPYIVDRNGQRYEITATFKDKRNYERELQNAMQNSAIQLFTEEEIKEIQHNRSNPNKDELIAKHKEKFMQIDRMGIEEEVNKKTFIKLLVKANNISEEKANSLVAELIEDYGYDQTVERIELVLDKVFTQLGMATQKAMPDWGLSD